MFTARPPAPLPESPGRDLHLVRAVHRSFTGPGEFLADPANRARSAAYLADMTRPYDREVRADLFGEPPSPDLGQSYGEMGEALIGAAVCAQEPVDLLVLAFSVHDLWPGRQTAAYLSHLTPGAPMAFAICDQGPAAAVSGLRVAREYVAAAAARRALLNVVEQAALPYPSPAKLPATHQGVAMLLGDGAACKARVAAVRQHPGVLPGSAASLAAAEFAELTARRQQVTLILGDALAVLWAQPSAGTVRVVPPGQPCTGVWRGLSDELADAGGHPDLLVVADYDPDLRYLSLTSFEARAQPRHRP